MIFFRSLLYSIFIYFSVVTGYADESAVDRDDVKKLINNQSVVELDDDAQNISGLQTIILKLTDYQPDFIAYGKAISVKPLLDIRRQYLIAASQLNSAEVKRSVTQKSLSRLQNLHKNEAVSTRKLQEQQSQWQSDNTLLNTVLLSRQIILAESRLQWGKTLTDWFTQTESQQIDNIITHRTQLLQITLPAGRQLPDGIETINIAADGDRKNAVPADFISVAPLIDPFSQGARYFFLSSSPAIQTGMRVTAWIPSQVKIIRGIIIPRSALLWHLGQAFVFVKLSDDSFSHRNIAHYIETPDGYFIASGIEEDEEIVSQGAQMLLSHEFRSLRP
jgi:hypothetical protein